MDLSPGKEREPRIPFAGLINRVVCKVVVTERQLPAVFYFISFDFSAALSRVASALGIFKCRCAPQVQLSPSVLILLSARHENAVWDVAGIWQRIPISKLNFRWIYEHRVYEHPDRSFRPPSTLIHGFFRTDVFCPPVR